MEVDQPAGDLIWQEISALLRFDRQDHADTVAVTQSGHSMTWLRVTASAAELAHELTAQIYNKTDFPIADLIYRTSEFLRLAVIGSVFGYFPGAMVLMRSAVEALAHAHLFIDNPQDLKQWEALQRPLRRPNIHRKSHDKQISSRRRGLQRRAFQKYIQEGVSQWDSDLKEYFWSRGSQETHSSPNAIYSPDFVFPEDVQELAERMAWIGGRLVRLLDKLFAETPDPVVGASIEAWNAWLRQTLRDLENA